MRIRRRNNLLVEPPSSATGDIAFNLVVFFLVCASVQPEKGIRLTIPSSETVEDKSQQSKHVEILLTRQTVALDGSFIDVDQLLPALEAKLRGKTREEDRVVVVKSSPDTPAHRWIRAVNAIKQARGVVTIQVEEERIVTIPE